MILHAGLFDWFFFCVYLAGVFTFGIYMSWKEKTPEGFFLAGRSLPWYAVAISLFATNISSGSLIGLAGDGYRYGLAVGTLEWGALFGLFLLAFVFLPYYQRRSVFTMPEFMELRYNLTVRVIFAVAVNIPFLFYAGGLAIQVMFNANFTFSVIGIGLFVGAYTAFGGLSAVVWTDVVQGLLMLLGGCVITVLGLARIGGFDALMDRAADKMHVCLPVDHPVFPFPATMIGGYFLVTIYYWCNNQTMVQRALGARSEWDARMGAMAACYIKLILPFIIVLPGIIAYVIFPQLHGVEIDKALPLLINQVVPIGLSGILMAAVVAALMSSADSSLNGWATIFTCDLYQRLFYPGADSKHLILVGRMAVVFVLCASIARTLTLGNTESILQFLLDGLAYISNPVIVLFLVGIFWARASSAAAVVTLLGSPIICYTTQTVMGQYYVQTSIVYWLPVSVTITIILMVVVSLITHPKEKHELNDLIWNYKDTLIFGQHLFKQRNLEGREIVPHSRLFLILYDHRLVGMIALALMTGIIWYFR